MPRGNTRQRLQKQVVIRRLENIFEGLQNVVLPETRTHIDTLFQCSDTEIICLAGDNIPAQYAMEIMKNMPATMRRDVWKTYIQNMLAFHPFPPPPPWELGGSPQAYVTFVNAVHSVRMSYDECLTVFPTCTPKWFGSWFASVTSCQMSCCKMWLPQIQQEPEPETQEQIQEESEGFQSCDEIEPDEEP